MTEMNDFVLRRISFHKIKKGEATLKNARQSRQRTGIVICYDK